MSSDPKTVEPKKESIPQPPEPNSNEMLASTSEFFSPTIGAQMTSADNFDFQENELGSSLMNGGSSTVYSPFFMQIPYPERSGSDSKYSASFGEDKSRGSISSFLSRCRRDFHHKDNSSPHHVTRVCCQNLKYLLHTTGKLSHREFDLSVRMSRSDSSCEPVSPTGK